MHCSQAGRWGRGALPCLRPQVAHRPMLARAHLQGRGDQLVARPCQRRHPQAGQDANVLVTHVRHRTRGRPPPLVGRHGRLHSTAPMEAGAQPRGLVQHASVCLGGAATRQRARLPPDPTAPQGARTHLAQDAVKVKVHGAAGGRLHSRGAQTSVQPATRGGGWGSEGGKVGSGPRLLPPPKAHTGQHTPRRWM